MNAFRTACTAVALIVCAAPAFGASVTYDFIEKGTTTVGGILEFASPPASATSGWSTSSASDVLNFQITDSSIAPVGTYNTNLSISSGGIQSQTGEFLDSGTVQGSMGSNTVITLIATGGTGLSGIGLDVPDTTFLRGDWTLATPEPSSLALVGAAAVVGLGLCARRRVMARRAAA